MFKKKTIEERLVEDYDIAYHLEQLDRYLGHKGYRLVCAKIRKGAKTGVLKVEECE